MWIPKDYQLEDRLEVNNFIKEEVAHKLSQNRNQNDYQNIIQELAQLNSPQANMMSDTLTKNQKK